MNLDETDPSQAKLVDLQEKSGEISDALEEIDTAMLQSCTAQERALQVEARRRLHEYFDQIWEEPKKATKGEVHPANLPAYAGVGAFKDLLMALWTNAQEAQDEAGDPVDSIRVETNVTFEDD
jgi:hypothetical protein